MITDINSRSEKHQPVAKDTALNRVLVVISPDLVKPGAPEESVLINRAVALAKATGCELELFHVCHDSSMVPAFFDDADQMRRDRDAMLDRDATLMAELVVRLASEGVIIRHDTRWDSPRSAAILRKIDECKPDLVMKQSREYDYVLGLLGNTDWDLIRQSPAHLWFVNENGSNEIERVVTAIGASAEKDEMIAAEDYSVFRFANRIAESFDGVNFPVHAYQVPQSIRAFAAYAPEFGGVAHPPPAALTAGQTRSEVARKHGKAIEAFADYFHLNLDGVRIAEGPASQVIPQAAADLHANLVVMAARQLSRWERLFRSVTAEPVLAAAPCDIVFIKNADDTAVPKAEKAAVHGMPVIDMEKAVLDPKGAFGSPHTLVICEELSTSMRHRILQIWEQDVRGQMREEDEGGPIRSTLASELNSIIAARSLLNHAAETEAVESAELTQQLLSQENLHGAEIHIHPQSGKEKKMASREDYIEKAKNQLDALNNKLDKLEAKAERASGELKNEIHQELNDLRASRTQVEGKLHELRSAGDAAWDDVKIGLEMAWKSLSESVDSAAQRFKS